jgi:predicted dehydrogenase
VFVDISVHDIDLTLWFSGDDAMPKSVSAHGITAVQPERQESRSILARPVEESKAQPVAEVNNDSGLFIGLRI